MARPGLTQPRIVATAVAIADAHGMDHVSMRRVAGELGVEAMSLYNHVTNKQALLEAMADYVWDQVDLGLDEPHWRAALHRLAASAFGAIVDHPWFLSLPVTLGGTARLHVINAQLAHMRGAGVSADIAFHAQHFIDGYIYGNAWQTVGYIDSEETQARAQQALAAIDPEQLPHLMEHVHQHMNEPPEGDGFRMGLDLLLDGLEFQRGPTPP